MARITAAMLAAGRKQLERHSWDTGGTYQVTCAADTLARDIFKAMLAAMSRDDKTPPEKARG
jgi:hypothetical protein